ncbi:DegT/DnrJ/EryC1/StrS family aminotransferase [Vibrio fortis]|uniref:DegT/DnrJ/EryC1/StrS family aminotransferase n=1 Tax=Vibrio fortis TaxID=212667 RepID=UPI004067B373
MIPVTKAYLPDIDKYKAYIDRIYDSGILTNGGPLVKKLEKRLEEYLGVRNLILVANGSLALQVAYKVLGLTGEVITTPFSFAATSSTLAWEGLKPVFCDIDSKTLNIDYQNIADLITENTSAILPVHVFGNACNVEEIQSIAEKFNLKVIYDAAHAFGIQSENSSLLDHGDISVVSFHATKIFHSIEGGAIIAKSDDDARKIRKMINFGLESSNEIHTVGTNAKMNEFEAAMGLCLLDDIDNIIGSRNTIIKVYKSELEGYVEFQEKNNGFSDSSAYMPIILRSQEELNYVIDCLNEHDVYPRRYFYPSLDTIEYLDSEYQCNKSRSVSEKIICLPLYVGLTVSEIEKICSIIRCSLSSHRQEL